MGSDRVSTGGFLTVDAGQGLLLDGARSPDDAAGRDHAMLDSGGVLGLYLAL
jgi:hypothetical protein